MRCTCPVCGLTGDYAARYAGKWHRCTAGCAPYPGTRLRLVPDGVGVTERAVVRDWRVRTHVARARFALLGLLGLALVPAPVVLPGVLAEAGLAIGRPLLLALTGLGATLAASSLHAAWRHAPLPPAGVSDLA